MKKPVLFIDFDGTICFDRFWRSAARDIQEKVQTYLFRENPSLVFGWMKGQYTSEEIHHFLASKLLLDERILWNIFVEDCKTMFVSPDILQEINSQRAKYTVVLITSNMDCFNRFTLPALRLNLYFDEIINSYYARKLKDDNGGELFLEVAQRYGADITQCIVLDDSPKVSSVFTHLGGKAFLVTAERKIEEYLKSFSS